MIIENVNTANLRSNCCGKPFEVDDDMLACIKCGNGAATIIDPQKGPRRGARKVAVSRKVPPRPSSK